MWIFKSYSGRSSLTSFPFCKHDNKKKNQTNSLTHFQTRQAQNNFHGIQREVLQTYLECNISLWSKCDFQQRNGILRWSLSKIQWLATSEEFGLWAFLCASQRSTCAHVNSCLLTLSARPSAAKLKAEPAESSAHRAWSGWSLAFVSASSLQSFISVIMTVLIKTCIEDPSCS